MNGLTAVSMKASSLTASLPGKVSLNWSLKTHIALERWFFWIWRTNWSVFFCYLGVYYFAESERTYEGSFSNNLFEGKGRLTYKDGRMYEGDFKAGKKDGTGTMVQPNGNKYIGDWSNDMKHGIGVWYNAKDGTRK